MGKSMLECEICWMRYRSTLLTFTFLPRSQSRILKDATQDDGTTKKLFPIYNTEAYDSMYRALVEYGRAFFSRSAFDSLSWPDINDGSGERVPGAYNHHTVGVCQQHDPGTDKRLFNRHLR